MQRTFAYVSWILIITLVPYFNLFSQSFPQLGNDLEGDNPDDWFGNTVVLDSKGTTMAVGAIMYGAGGSDSGQVKVYSWNGTNWVQKGKNIDAEGDNNLCGVSLSLSANGDTLAVGAHYNDGSGTNSGHVRVFIWNGNSWIQLGSDIDGEAAGDLFGASVSLSTSGNILAVGGHFNNGNGNEAGHVRVFVWNGSTWTQRGNDIDGEAAGDWFGIAVDLSDDGNTLAAGAPRNDGNGISSGHVRVYTWSTNKWIRKGSDIDGEAAIDFFGRTVKLSSDGNTLAAGAIFNDGNGTNAGHVRVYAWNSSSWTQKGNDIDGESGNDNSGISISLSADGNKLAIGAYKNSGYSTQAGHVRFFGWNSTAWVQIGADIDGEAAYDQCGISVCLNADGSYLACGANLNDGNGSNAGHVRAFLLKIMTTVNQAACDSFYWPLTALYYHTSGDYYDTLKTSTGEDSIVVLNLVINPSTASQVFVNVCDSFVSPSKQYIWKSSGIYSDTIKNYSGCDSIIKVNLSINVPSASSIHVQSCNSYVSPSGNYIWTQSGTYYDTITNSFGCDSIIIIHLEIKGSSFNTLFLSACNSQLSPSGKFIWTQSGSYFDTIQNQWGCDSVLSIDLKIYLTTNANISTQACNIYASPSLKHIWAQSGYYEDTITNHVGCDSIIHIDLTIYHDSYDSVFVRSCDAYTSPSGNYIWTLSGNYKDTIPGYYGCDSIISIALVINRQTTDSIQVSVCDQYVSPSGNYTWTTSGIYTDTLTNAQGCDSVLYITLKMRNSTTSSVSLSACKLYISPSGKYSWMQSGLYQDTISNTAGCDSIISIDLTINAVDTSITFSENVLYANALNASYQWLYCDSNFKAIDGETSYEFKPKTSGSYAVEIKQNLCIDTSFCYQVKANSIAPFSQPEIIVYPNPSDGLYFVEFQQPECSKIELFNGYGVQVQSFECSKGSFMIDLRNGKSGVYWLRIENKAEVYIQKLILL